jgi:hypothetical protein
VQTAPYTQPAHTTFVVSIIKTTQIALFMETTADKSQNRRKLINILLTLNDELLKAEAGGTYNYQ